ncbi:MAG TPA: efflux RND transporter periplasmic adaptor subunit, partial [Vicinamibacteria bacterium]|nr:efflux RND transporter periplasmic adaptor subunit [Vicinamibacteria bacterium]
LFQAGIVSAQALDQARTEHQVGEGNLEAARQVLARVEAGPRREDIAAAGAGLTAARARWIGASHRLEYAKVRAPIAGRVLKKFRNAGDFVSPDTPHLEGYETVAVGSPVVSLADLGRQQVSVDVNQTDIARIALHQRVEVSSQAYPEDVWVGSVTQISPRADKNKNTIEVKVTLEAAARVLPYDMSVKLDFLGQAPASGSSAVRIPAAALVEKEGRHVVFVVADSRASERPVEVGARQDEMVALTKGLVEGDRVIVSGLDQLKDGSPIRLK